MPALPERLPISRNPWSILCCIEGRRILTKTKIHTLCMLKLIGNVCRDLDSSDKLYLALPSISSSIHLRPHPWQLQVCDQEQVADACEHALGCGPNFKYHYKNGKYIGAPHQYNCTYFSALKKDDQSYLLVSFSTCPAQVGDSGSNSVKRLIPPFYHFTTGFEDTTSPSWLCLGSACKHEEIAIPAVARQLGSNT